MPQINLSQDTVDTTIAALQSAIITYRECQQQHELARTQFERAAFHATGDEKTRWTNDASAARRLVAQFAHQVLNAQDALNVFESLEAN